MTHPPKAGAYGPVEAEIPAYGLHAERPQRVLVTGAAGYVGRVVAAELVRRGHAVRGFDIASMPNLTDAVVADLTDRAAVDAAMIGIETVVHLAAFPNDADFMTTLLEPNIVGVYHIFEAAIAAGVRRMIAVSTAQVLNRLERETYPVHPDGPIAPNNHYAVTKLFLESMGQMYHHRNDLDVLIVRPGWFLQNPVNARYMQTSPRAQAIYLSHRDAGRFFARAVEAPNRFGFARLFACSGSPAMTMLNMEPARRLIGYVPSELFPVGLPENWLDS